MPLLNHKWSAERRRRAVESPIMLTDVTLKRESSYIWLYSALGNDERVQFRMVCVPGYLALITPDKTKSYFLPEGHEPIEWLKRQRHQPMAFFAAMSNQELAFYPEDAKEFLAELSQTLASGEISVDEFNKVSGAILDLVVRCSSNFMGTTGLFETPEVRAIFNFLTTNGFPTFVDVSSNMYSDYLMLRAFCDAHDACATQYPPSKL